MVKLYFRYGAVGNSRTVNALMVDYNYHERGKQAFLVKPKADFKDGNRTIHSRMGLEKEGILLEESVEMAGEETRKYDRIIVNEAQSVTKAQVEFSVHIVNDLDVPVICYGLRTDFRRGFFERNLWPMVWTDKTEEIKTVCRCGKAATYNARIGEDGKTIQSGEQTVIGGNDKYTALCRKHHWEGSLGK